MPYTTLHIRLDSVVASRARRVAKRFGLTLPDIIRLFLSQFARKPHIEIAGGIEPGKKGKK